MSSNNIPPPYQASDKQKGAGKTARIPIKIIPAERLPKPDWIRVKAASPTTRFYEIKDILRSNNLVTVCEEASCPNIGECFGKGTATFMIMGDKCTRRCPFCDVGHGRPDPLNPDEPASLAKTIAALQLRYVVITSVDRDDLDDGGAEHFAQTIRAIRHRAPGTTIEILTPDFLKCAPEVLEVVVAARPDVFNHNLETVPSLYLKVRPGSDYQWSLNLLKQYKEMAPDVITKSGIMVGIGETREEVIQVMADMKEHKLDMVTIGQYLQPSRDHLPVDRFLHPDEFAEFERIGMEMGFRHVASAPLVRSSYHADKQSKI